MWVDTAFLWCLCWSFQGKAEQPLRGCSAALRRLSVIAVVSGRGLETHGYWTNQAAWLGDTQNGLKTYNGASGAWRAVPSELHIGLLPLRGVGPGWPQLVCTPSPAPRAHAAHVHAHASTGNPDFMEFPDEVLCILKKIFSACGPPILYYMDWQSWGLRHFSYFWDGLSHLAHE